MKFTSVRLLEAWAGQQPAYHTALDDMESVVWLLVWVLLLRRPRDELSDSEQGLLGAFSSNNVARLADAKRALFRDEHYKDPDFTWQEGNELLAPIVCEWLAIAEEMDKEARAMLKPGELQEVDNAELDRVTHQYYLRFLESGVRFLSSKGVYE